MAKARAAPTKCTRPPCQNTCSDPRQDGWHFIEMHSMPLRFTGYYCPVCAEFIHELHRLAGVEPITKPHYGDH